MTETVAEEVRALMARRGVVQMQLSDVLNVSQTGVSKRLRGLIPFDANEIGLLAEFFGVEPVELLGETPNGPRPGPDGGTRATRYAIRDSNPEPADMVHSRPDLQLVA